MEVTPASTYSFGFENVVKDYFAGTGIVITNVDYEGDNKASGTFINGHQAISIDEGILMTSGYMLGESGHFGANNTGADFANNSNYATAVSPNLLQLSGNANLYDVTRITITFIPLGDTITFDYVFASEEYPEFPCSQFNDIFGFFIQGDGYALPTNIATISGTNLPVSINNIHPQNPNDSSCAPLNVQYYNNNELSMVQPVYDGFTNVFRVQAVVTPCTVYTMELAIADVGDRAYDSAVFLRGKSFKSNALGITQRTAGNGNNIGEGCTSADISIQLPQITNQNQQINYTVIGSATNGIDYEYITNSLTIPAGDSVATITLKTITDNTVEPGGETVGIVIPVSTCKTDTIWYVIRDYILDPVDLTSMANSCTLLDVTATIPVSAGQNITYQNVTDFSILSNQSIVFSDIEINSLASPLLIDSTAIQSVCVNINHNWVNDLNIWLYAPNGNVLELSTKNGQGGDNYHNTCFSPTASQSITTGIAPFSGSWRPEGSWHTLTNNLNSLNGVWRLAVQDAVSGVNGTLLDWSITFAPPYEVYYEWSPSDGLSCTDCPVIQVAPETPTMYYLTVSDNYGCAVIDSMLVNNTSECPSGFPNCFDAYVAPFCEGIEGLSGTLSSDNGSGEQVDCNGQSIVITNPTYYGFIAGKSGSGAITVNYYNCQNLDQDENYGVQGLLVSECNIQVPLDCSYAPSTTPNGSFTLSYTDFSEGCFYTLVLDGFQQDVCDFVIHESIPGLTAFSPPLAVIESAQGNTVCVGDTALFAVPNMGYACGQTSYQWFVSGTGTILGGATTPALTVMPAGVGTMQVYCTIYNPCDTQFVQRTVQVENCACNFAGTVSIGAFTGQSNDISLNTIYLCKGDSIHILHNGDYDLSGDPVPATAPGIVYGFYQCAPTISGPTYNDIAADPCTFDQYQVYGETPEGNVTFWNQGQVQNLLANGYPVQMWFAPVTIDNFSTLQYESVGGGIPPGSCVNANIDAAFSVVYLNEIQATGITVSTILTATFTLTGGLPEWDGSAYQITITKAGNPGMTGTVISGPALNGSTVTIQVPEGGEYLIRVEDEKSCGMVFSRVFQLCQLGVSLDLSNSPSCNGGNDGSVYVQLYQGVNAVTDFSGYLFNWNIPGAGNVPSFENVVAGQYTVTVTELATGCSASAGGALAQPSPIVVSIQPQSICFGLQNGVAVVSVAGGSPPYSFVGSGGIISGNIPGGEYAINNLAASLYSITITDNNFCTSGGQSFNITENALPQVSVSNGALGCQTPSTELTVTTNITNGQYNWSGPGGFTGQTATVSVSQTGSYVVTVTDTFTGCSNTATATVVNDESLPPADAGPDRFFCTGQPLQLTAAPGGSDYLWRDGSGNILGTNDTLIIAPSQQPIYTILLTVTGINGCINRDTVNINPGTPVTASIAGNTAPCITEAGTLLVASGGDYYDWGNGITNDSLLVYPNSTSPATYEVVVTNAQGCSNSAGITINPQLTAQVSIEGETAICLGSSTVLHAQGGSGTSVFLWENNSQSVDRTVSPVVTTQYRVIGFTSSTNCPDTARFTVQVLNPPVANAGVDQVACMSEAELTALLAPNSGNGVWIAQQSGTPVADPYASSTTASGLQTGANRFVWQVTSPPCPGTDADTLLITLADQLPVANADHAAILPDSVARISVVANDSISLLPGFTVHFQETDNNGIWQLLPDGRLTFEPEPGFKGAAAARYRLCNALCPDLCSETEVVIQILEPEDDIGGTLVITPVPEDGKNDDLQFPYLDQYPDNSITIFNRWGQQVYHAKPYNNDWKGTYNGKPLPEGTYYYILNLRGEDEVVWGNVLILR